MSDLQRALARARKAAGGRGHLAKLLDVPVRTLEDWESGRRVPPTFTAAAVIEACEKVARAAAGKARSARSLRPGGRSPRDPADGRVE